MRLSARSLLAGFTAAGLFGSTACDGTGTGPTPSPTPSAVTISPAEATVNAAGDSVRFTAEVRDADGDPIPDAEVVWSTPDAEHLVVRDDGTAVPSVHPEPLAVVARSGEAADTAWLVSRQVPATLEIDADDQLALVEFEGVALAAVVRDSGGTALQDPPEVRWKTTDSTIAVVDAAGRVEAWYAGQAWIEASVDGAVDSVRVTVEPMEPVEFADVDGGYTSNVCALDADGRAFCWGGNVYGSLGAAREDLVYATRPIPVETEQRFEQIIAGNRHACGLTGSGEVWCWGEASFIAGLADEECRGLPCALVPARVEGLPPVASLHGTRVTCAVTTGGEAHCLEDGRIVALFSEQEVQSVATTEHQHCVLTTAGEVRCVGRQSGNVQQVASDPAYRALTGGYAHLCARRDDGSTDCWGSNYTGQLGVGDVFTREADPTTVAGANTFRALTASGYVSPHSFDLWVPAPSHTCAVATDGTGYCWGANNAGQVGNNAAEAHCQPWIESSPCEVVPREVAGVAGFEEISAGGAFSCGIATAGVLYCWGANTEGSLGTGMLDLPPDQCADPFECSRTPLPVYGQRQP